MIKIDGEKREHQIVNETVACITEGFRERKKEKKKGLLEELASFYLIRQEPPQRA